MKRLYFIGIVILSVLTWGCNEFQETGHSDSPDMTLTIKNVRSEAESITLTLHAEGEDKDMYIRWGVTYSETDDKTAGKAKAIDGSPSEGKAEVCIDGLDGGQTYHIWGWAYDRNGDRIWTEESTKAKTTEKPKPKPAKLSGTIIGSTYSVDYDNGNAQSTTVNTKDNVFDGNFDTYFASYDRSGTWVGYDLGKKHVITKIGYSPRITQPGRVELAMIEGANMPDFSDAIPIHMIKSPAPERQMTYEETNCSRGFRYVRYVSPNDVRCNLAELEFYGYADEGNDSKLYQITNLPTVVINTEGAQEIVYNSLVRFIEKDRATLPREKWPVIYEFSQNDNIHYICLCPECKKMKEREGSESGALLNFLNPIAEKIAKKGYALRYEVQTNMVFCIIPPEKLAELEEVYDMHYWHELEHSVRLATTHMTTEAEIDALVAML